MVAAALSQNSFGFDPGPGQKASRLHVLTVIAIDRNLFVWRLTYRVLDCRQEEKKECHMASMVGINICRGTVG